MESLEKKFALTSVLIKCTGMSRYLCFSAGGAGGGGGGGGGGTSVVFVLFVLVVFVLVVFVLVVFVDVVFESWARATADAKTRRRHARATRRMAKCEDNVMNFCVLDSTMTRSDVVDMDAANV